MKEASHFLRNIGLGDNLAILDRHILKNLVILGVIKEIPKTISAKKYEEIENLLLVFSDYCKIKPFYLDFILWHREANDIFK